MRWLLIPVALLVLAGLWALNYGGAWRECVAWGYGWGLCVYKGMLP